MTPRKKGRKLVKEEPPWTTGLAWLGRKLEERAVQSPEVPGGHPEIPC